MDFRGVTVENISEAVNIHGAAPGGVACLRGEEEAAQESLENGLYITWGPKEDCFRLIREDSVREKYEGGREQCCRVGSLSVCLCGHKLIDHKEVHKKSSFIRPPKCNKSGCRCFGFNYMPSRPEECGQWWLPRRKDFDLKAWRRVSTTAYSLFFHSLQRVQSNPEEYACIGCDLKITDHETMFETRQQRLSRGVNLIIFAHFAQARRSTQRTFPFTSLLIYKRLYSMERLTLVERENNSYRSDINTLIYYLKLHFPLYKRSWTFRILSGSANPQLKSITSALA